MNAAISSGLECWGQYDDTQHQSSSWATQMLASAIVSDCRGFCVQYEAQLDGVNFTSGGCLGQLIGQSAGLDVISCEWDGQKKVVVAPFLGRGPSVPLTVYCCTTHLCNGCSHGLSPVTGFSAAIRSTDHGRCSSATYARPFSLTLQSKRLPNLIVRCHRLRGCHRKGSRANLKTSGGLGTMLVLESAFRQALGRPLKNASLRSRSLRPKTITTLHLRTHTKTQRSRGS